MQKQEYVVLVDQEGKPTGLEEKLKAHQLGLLHKAFSVLIFNDAGEILLQQRSFAKYHTPGLWSNSCCSHPREGETLPSAVQRRLQEELGFSTEVKEQFSFVYKFQDNKSLLWEHEHDTVFTGIYNGPINFSEEEVNAVKWISLNDLKQWIKSEPAIFTFWFKEFLPKITNEINLVK